MYMWILISYGQLFSTLLMNKRIDGENTFRKFKVKRISDKFYVRKKRKQKFGVNYLMV